MNGHHHQTRDGAGPVLTQCAALHVADDEATTELSVQLEPYHCVVTPEVRGKHSKQQASSFKMLNLGLNFLGSFGAKFNALKGAQNSVILFGEKLPVTTPHTPRCGGAGLCNTLNVFD